MKNQPSRILSSFASWDFTITSQLTQKRISRKNAVPETFAVSSHGDGEVEFGLVSRMAILCQYQKECNAIVEFFDIFFLSGHI